MDGETLENNQEATDAQATTENQAQQSEKYYTEHSLQALPSYKLLMV